MVKFTNYSLLSSPFELLNRILSNHITPVFGSWLNSTLFSISGCSPHRSKLRVHVMVPPADPPRLLNPRRPPWLQRMAGFSMAGGGIVWLKKPRKNPRMKRIGVFLTLLRKEIGQKRVYLPRWSKSKIDEILYSNLPNTDPTKVHVHVVWALQPLQNIGSP